MRFERRGKRVLEPGALTIADPLRLAVREIPGGGDARSCSCCRASSRCWRPGPRRAPVAWARGPTRAAAGPRCAGAWTARRPSSTSTACARTARARRPRASTGPPWPAAARCSSGGSPRTPTRPRWWCSTPPRRRRTRRSTRRCARRRRCACTSAAGRAARCCCPATAVPPCSRTDMAAWPVAPRAAGARAGRRAPGPPLARARRAGAVIWVSARGDAPRDLARAAGGGGWLVTPLESAARAPRCRSRSPAARDGGWAAPREEGRMSAAAARLAPGCVRRLGGRPARARDRVLRLAAFAGLAAFVCGHWAAHGRRPAGLPDGAGGGRRHRPRGRAVGAAAHPPPAGRGARRGAVARSWPRRRWRWPPPGLPVRLLGRPAPGTSSAPELDRGLSAASARSSGPTRATRIGCGW